MITLRLSSPDGRPIIRSTRARSRIGPVERPLRGRLGDRVRAAIERREALDELRDPLDRHPPQVGLVGGAERRHPDADAAVLVDQPRHRLVDEVGGGGFASPRQHQLDRPVGHLPLGGGGLPLELVGREVVLLAVERRTDPVLGDEDVVARLEPLARIRRGRRASRCGCRRPGPRRTRADRPSGAARRASVVAEE